MKFSVIVCTYNPNPAYLIRVLSGLKRQTINLAHWGLLIVDNGSSTPVSEKCEASWQPKLHFIKEMKQGLTHARLAGISASSGEYIVFVDDDNVLNDRYLETAQSLVESFPSLAVFGSGKIVPEFEIPPRQEIQPYLQMLALREIDTASWSNDPFDTHIP